METIMVLTDFSETSLQAAQYAFMLARRFEVQRMLLLNTYRLLAPATDVPIKPEAGEDLKQSSLNRLNTFRNTLGSLAGPGDISVQLVSVEAELAEAVNEIGASEKIGLVVMGMTGKSGLINALMGSNSSRLLTTCNFPLIVVPRGAPMALPGRIAVATDLKDVQEKIPSAILKDLLHKLQPTLFVVNVATGTENYDPEIQKGISSLHELLDLYNAQYHYINNADIVDGINLFTQQYNISLIIVTHKSHTGLAAFFHKSISKKLATHIEVPLMILPQQEASGD